MIIRPRQRLSSPLVRQGIHLITGNKDSNDPLAGSRITSYNVCYTKLLRYAADLTEDGRIAVVSTVDRGVLVWDLPQNKVRYQWEHKEGAANDVFLVRISASGTHA